YDIVRTTFKGVSKGDFEEGWKKFLHDGFLANSAAPQPAVAQFDFAAAAKAINISPLPAPTRDQMEVVFQRDYTLDDGRWNNNGWLQELPDPVTKVAWENVILMSPKTKEGFDLAVADHLSGKSVVSRVKVELD